MSEAATESRELTATSRPVREYRVVENALGIMDTARFEHLGRVATVLARAGLMPMSLTHFKPPGSADNVQPMPLEYEVVQARAFLIANQADLFGMDPNALAQCVSIVHGKLMYEGKLVHALISAKLGVDLVYEFGRFELSRRDIAGQYVEEDGDKVWVGEMPTSADDQTLGVRVLGTLPGERKPRMIAGSVAMWHKGAKSPWGSTTAWPRQLRYMGAREWCRAHKPSLLLGIMTDDEVDEYELGRQTGALPAPPPQIVHSGFSDVRQAELIPPEQGRKPRAARAKPPESKPEPETSTKAEDVNKPALDAALGGDNLPAETPAQDPIYPGHAPPGEVYIIAGQQPNGDGRWPTHKDGKPFSTVGSLEAAPIYQDHAPAHEPQKPAEETVAEQKPAASASEERTADDDDEDLPPDLHAFVDKVDNATDFETVKFALKEFMQTPLWKSLGEDQANRIRGNTWDTMAQNFTPEALPDHTKDVSAFRLWIEAQDDPKVIEQGLASLESDPGFAGKPDPLKEQLRGAAQACIKALEP